MELMDWSRDIRFRGEIRNETRKGNGKNYQGKIEREM